MLKEYFQGLTQEVCSQPAIGFSIMNIVLTNFRSVGNLALRITESTDSTRSRLYDLCDQCMSKNFMASSRETDRSWRPMNESPNCSEFFHGSSCKGPAIVSSYVGIEFKGFE